MIEVRILVKKFFGISSNSGYLQDIVIWINSWRGSHVLAIFEGSDFGVIILDPTAVSADGMKLN